MIIVIVPLTIHHHAKANQCSQILLIEKEEKLIVMPLIPIVILTPLQLGVRTRLKMPEPHKILPTTDLRGRYHSIRQHHAIRTSMAHPSTCINGAIRCVTSVVYQAILLLNVTLIHHYPEPSQRTYGIFINVQYLIANRIFLSQTRLNVVKRFLEIRNVQITILSRHSQILLEQKL